MGGTSVEHDGCACLEQSFGRGSADAARRAGHDGHAAAEVDDGHGFTPMKSTGGRLHEAAFSGAGSSGTGEGGPNSGRTVRSIMPLWPVLMPFSMIRAGLPATRQFDGTSFITTLAAATTQLSPTLTPAMIMLFAPILHCFPIQVSA